MTIARDGDYVHICNRTLVGAEQFLKEKRDAGQNTERYQIRDYAIEKKEDKHGNLIGITKRHGCSVWCWFPDRPHSVSHEGRPPRCHENHLF